MNTVIQDLGTLSPQLWPGKISRTVMIADKFTTDNLVEAAVLDINEYYVDIDPHAPTRCIDGRSNPIADVSHLGPQVPAGTPGAALAYHLTAVDDIADSYLLDAQAILTKLIAGGIVPGGHRDQHNALTDRVGCGAIDGMDTALVTMLDASMAEDHERITRKLLGNEFDVNAYDEIIRGAAALLGPESSFFNGREAIIDEIESKYPNSVGVLVGDHHECIVAINTVKGTTLSTNQFGADHNDVQAFGYDVWRTPQVASILFPSKQQNDLRQQFVMARIMTAVATLMVLTDGSQRLVVRSES